MSGSNLLLIVTGSIAAAKACDVISRLVQRGHRVRCAATPAARRFVGPAMLEGLTGTPVLADLFARGAALEHINLTRWADLVLICPATANTINRLAVGLADDLPGALFLAREPAKRWLVAPAMNPAMWAHPATRASVERLRSWGVEFLPVGEGRTACGEVGEGRMPEPDAIVAAVEGALARPACRLRVLVTAGGTAEPVDAVRVLTNRSTGATGALLASHLRQRGHAVTLLRARHAVPPELPGEEETFETFADLDAALGRQLAGGRFDAVIHAAAVSDFGVEVLAASGAVQPPGSGKLDSASPPRLRLRRHPRLVDTLRERSPVPVRIVAFKLTAGAGPAEARAAVERLFAHSGADFVVHNDMESVPAGRSLPADIFRPDGTLAARCPDRATLAAELARLLEEAPGDRLPVVSRPASGSAGGHHQESAIESPTS